MEQITNETHQWGGDAVWAWVNHARSREVIVTDQKMLCHTRCIVLAGVGSYLDLFYHRGSSYVSNCLIFELKALPVRIYSIFSSHTSQLSTAMLLSLVRNDNDNDHSVIWEQQDHLMNTRVLSPALTSLSSLSLNPCHNPQPHELWITISPLYKWANRIREVKSLAGGHQAEVRIGAETRI